MRISRIYCEQELSVGNDVMLDADSTHYLANVLRLKSGSDVILFNAAAGDIKGTIKAVSKKALTVTLDESVAPAQENKLAIHLGLGLSKGDRMDYAIQKSVELGVSEITPLYTAFNDVKIKTSDRLQNKLRHWQRVSISATEQCGAQSPASIHTPINFEEFVSTNHSATKLMLDAEADANLNSVNAIDDVTLLVGPEGGFSAEERVLARAKGFNLINLGPRILRTETAPVAALAVLQHLFGNR